MSEVNYKSDLTSHNLEQSFSTLTEKLSILQQDLSKDEQIVFHDIINSAVSHLQSLEETANVEQKLSYLKPISAAATMEIRSQIIALPQSLGID